MQESERDKKSKKKQVKVELTKAQSCIIKDRIEGITEGT